MSAFTDTLAIILFHGLAQAMVLYLISVGLSVTMGLMGFVNLAHGVFAMIGGYILTSLMGRYSVPFFPALLMAVAGTAAVSAVLERMLYRPFYGEDEVDQVLMTMGLIFISIATATYVWGPVAQSFHAPAALSGQLDLRIFSVPAYRSFLILCGASLVTALWLAIERTRFGARIRAAVDNLRMAQTLGMNTSRLFFLTFVLGSSLAALGGALGAELLAVTPTYALENMVLFLIVVTLGGLGSIKGPFFAALLVGIVDTGLKYLVPEFGAFFVYFLTLIILFWFPRGVFGRV